MGLRKLTPTSTRKPVQYKRPTSEDQQLLEKMKQIEKEKLAKGEMSGIKFRGAYLMTTHPEDYLDDIDDMLVCDNT